MSAPRIEPRTLKGFRDYLPEAMIPREWLIDTARRVYRSYGFSPIDTPAPAEALRRTTPAGIWDKGPRRRTAAAGLLAWLAWRQVQRSRESPE